MKRVFDSVIAFLLLLILWPLGALIALAIATTSPGPVIFRQARVGKGGKTFIIFKFRTMAHGSGRLGYRTSKNDSRVTVVGKFLRRSHLDELPQLINVLQGRMSLVGPRPLVPECIYEMELKHPNSHERLNVLPGMTGMVQILGRETTKGPDGGLSLDLEYVRHHNFLLDLKILLKTVLVLFRLQGI
jgi:undecaprenyl phosphate N,N'-diacetylbacillosamine 1-phosphate transferase